MFVSWVATNWFNLLQTIAIVSGLAFTSRSLLIDSKIRKIQNLLTITEAHRTIWLEIFENPELLRILKPNADVERKEVSLKERIS